MRSDTWINGVHLEQLYDDIQVFNKGKAINIKIDDDGMVIKINKHILDILNEGSKYAHRDLKTNRIYQILVTYGDEE